MPPRTQTRDEMSSGTEFALQALQGQIEAYTETVRSQMQDLAKQLREHSRDQKEWQEKVDKGLHEALAYGKRIDKLELTVDSHEKVYQQGQGAAWAGKIVWALLGALVSALVWVYVQFVVPAQSHASPPSVPNVTHPVPSPTPNPGDFSQQ